MAPRGGDPGQRAGRRAQDRLGEAMSEGRLSYPQEREGCLGNPMALQKSWGELQGGAGAMDGCRWRSWFLVLECPGAAEWGG